MDLRDRKTTKPLIILAYMHNTTGEGMQQIMMVMRNDHYYTLLSIFSFIMEMTYQYLIGVYARVHNCFFSLPVTQK